MTTLIADLHPSCSAAAVKLNVDLDRIAEARAFAASIAAESDIARRDLAAATADQDIAKAHDAANRLREAELTAGAVEVPRLSSDAIAAVLGAIEAARARFDAEVRAPRSGQSIEARARLTRTWKGLNYRAQSWAKTGEPPDLGAELLAEASRFSEAIDAYLVEFPVPARAENALAPRPSAVARQFTDMNLRHSQISRY